MRGGKSFIQLAVSLVCDCKQCSMFNYPPLAGAGTSSRTSKVTKNSPMFNKKKHMMHGVASSSKERVDLDMD